VDHCCHTSQKQAINFDRIDEWRDTPVYAGLAERDPEIRDKQEQAPPGFRECRRVFYSYKSDAATRGWQPAGAFTDQADGGSVKFQMNQAADKFRSCPSENHARILATG